MKTKRQEDILGYILSERSVTVAKLGEIFHVSLMTIRRDLTELEESGLLTRVSGGAVVANGTEKEPSYKVRMFWNSEQKERIATLAEKFVCDDDLIFLDLGTTCLQCAKKLYERNITVVTNWLPNMLELSRASNCEVINLGGQINKDELSSVGVSAYNAVGSFSFVRAFIGVGGITEDGISDYRVESVEIKRRVIECAKEVIVLADHSKFGKKTSVHIASFDKINKIIVADIANVNEKLLQQIKNSGVEIIN